MLTCREYLDNFPENPPEEVHVNGLDLLNHILQGDTQQTWYKNKDDERKFLYEMQEEMEKHCENDSLDQVLQDTLTQKEKWIRFDGDDGDLDVERFIQNNGSNDMQIFDCYKKTKKAKPAMTLVMDCAIPYMERSSGDMAKRHKEVYTMAVQSFMEGRPCRVIAVWSCLYKEQKEPTKFFITIKDFNDPIFSGMWGAFKSNRTTNSFLNVIMDYFVGTFSRSNGQPRDLQITKYIPREECELIDPKRVHY